jgi:phosphocarrier protein
MEKITEEVVVNSAHGLHVRPAAFFVQIANEFDSSVMLEKDGEKVDGKSIMTLLSLGINRGSKITLIVEGPDAQNAFVALKKFLETSND